MKNLFILGFLTFLWPIEIYSQDLKGSKQKKVGRHYNNYDELGRAQGFCKIMLPDVMGHSTNYDEGIFYNNKKIGVWYKRNYQGKKYEMEIFYDTLQSKIEHFSYYLNSQMPKEHGFYLMTAMEKADTSDYEDPITHKQKRIIWDSTNMKQGRWEYYYENGQVREEGLYENDKKKELGRFTMRQGTCLK